MDGLRTTAKAEIEQEVIKNLLSAQKRIAEEGDSSEVIRITRYLLRLAQKRGNVLVDVFSKSDE